MNIIASISSSSIAHSHIQPIHTPDAPSAPDKPKLTRSQSLPSSPAAPKPARGGSSATMLAALTLGNDLGPMDDIPFKSLKMTKADLREMAKEVNKLPMPPKPAGAGDASKIAEASTSKKLQSHVQQNANLAKKRQQESALVRKELEMVGQSMRSLASIAEEQVLESELGGAFDASARFFSRHQDTSTMGLDLDDGGSDVFSDPEFIPEEDDGAVLIRQNTRRSDGPSTPPRESGRVNGDIPVDIAADIAVDIPPPTETAAPLDAARKAEVQKLLANIPNWRAALVSGNAGVNLMTNTLLSAARDGTITAVATYARELVGHAIRNADNMSDETREAITYGILSATAVLNVATVVLQKYKGTDNMTTRICNGINVAAAAGIAIALSKTDTAGLGATAGLMAKAVAYVFTRDTLNYVFPIGDSMDPGTSGAPLSAGFAGAVQYGAVSAGASYAQSRPHVFSGTSGTAAAFDIGDAALHKGVAQFAAINGTVEAFDGVNFTYATAAMQGRTEVDIDDVKRGGKLDVVLTPSIRPFFKPQDPNNPDEPPQTFAGAAKDHAKGYMEKVLGPMTKRLSALNNAYGALTLMNKFVPDAINEKLHPDEFNAVFNVALGAGASIAGYPVFVGALATSPEPTPTEQPERRRPEAHGDEAV